MQSFEKSWPRLARATITGLTVLVTICFAGSFAVGGTISTGTVLPDYALVSVGPAASVKVNTGPINGRVLLGNGSTSSSSGGNNGAITGGVDVSGTDTGDHLGKIQFPPAITFVAPSIAMQAFSDAATLSAQASTLGLNPTQSFSGTVSGSITLTGNGGLNVINFQSLQNPTITISGGPDDLFVINVSGKFAENHMMTLQGVSASQILWNFTATSGNELQTSGGATLYGTFLATRGANFAIDNVPIQGAVINTGGHIEFVSGAKITAFLPFTVGDEGGPPPPVIPEPSSMLLFGTGLVACAGVLRRKAAARFRQCAIKVFGAEPMQVSELAPSGANRSA